jgi:hypothetical protein
MVKSISILFIEFSERSTLPQVSISLSPCDPSFIPFSGGVFYDLGSGTGKALFATRLVCDFSRCIGIEILQALHKQAAAIVHKYNEEFRDMLSAGMHQTANVYVVYPLTSFPSSIVT